jgi:multidrug efflux pump subunit AcrA (membrane-fusion protein)
MYRVRRLFTRRAGVPLALVGTAVAVALFATACSSGPNSAVKVAAVGYSTVQQVVQAPANIVPKAQVSVTASADGTLAELDVHDGQHVAAGQLLGRISSPAAQQQLAQAKQAAAQATSAGAGIPATGTGFTDAAASARSSAAQSFDQARGAAERIADPRLRQTLLDQISATQSSYDAAINAVSEAIGQFEQGLASASQVLSALGQAQSTQAQAAVDVAQHTVDALTLTAAIPGTVTFGNGQAATGSAGLGSLSQLISQAGGGSNAAAQALGSAAGGTGNGGGGDGSSVISVGSPISSGGTLFTVTDASSLSVAAQVDETDVLTVKPGVVARIQLNAVPGATYTGTVTAIDPGATTSSQGGVTYTVRLSLGSGTLSDGAAAPEPLPGMSAIANLDVLTARDALSVPSAALVTDGDTTSVWLVSGGVAHKRAIRLGAQGDIAVQVLSGLAAGNRIVVTGADKVTDGQRVG